MQPQRVVVIGGYGFFGGRLVARLAQQPGLHIVVAGRSLQRCHERVDALRATAVSELSGAMLDAQGPGLAAALQALRPAVVVHTAGPFQGQAYDVARACIAAGAHYLDLADGREFVTSIGSLGPAAEAAGVAVISGASSVPALSSAVVDHLAEGFATLKCIDIGISPGNRTERGLSTVQAILSYCGQPLPVQGAAPVFGWHGSHRHHYAAPVGRRWLSPCDVPDLTLLPARYPGRPAVRFGAGLELAWLHFGMNAMALMTRLGIVADWSVHARVLKRAADAFRHWGSDAGAMHVSVTGQSATGVRRTRTWELVATKGDGPFVPTLAAAAVVRKLRQGSGIPPGALPCVGLLGIDDFVAEARGLNVAMQETGS
jgi:hypothetical protein